jgi:ADP-dependent NAD(P)H-hydrate dehydratase / NAD(P)H-hydrate epimerase
MHDWLRPLHDAEGMRAVDSWAIEERGVPSLELMEAAGAAVAEAVRGLAPGGPARVVCGKGNNAGDGLVAARHLRETGFEVEVLLLWPAGELSGDAAANLERVDGAREVSPEEVEAALAGSGAIVDAIFGTGFSGAPRSPAADAIAAINGTGAPVVAADVASGVDAATGEVDGPAVDATLTVAFHAAKLGHRIAPGKRHTGELRVAAIGIPPGAPVQAAGGEIGEEVLALQPRRGPDSTKFTSGQVLVAGGSRGLTGAVTLSATAAIRAGAGYATAAVPADLEAILEVKLTEVMTRGCPSEGGSFGADAADAVLAAAERAAAVVLGPGIGPADGAHEVARRVAHEVEAPLVLDADGLNAHAGLLARLSERTKPTVITPHAGELGRLLARSSDEIGAHRLAAAREAAAEARSVVVLKGDDTLVVDGASSDQAVAVNVVSAPALATAGTGDVLAGTIGALMARGLPAFEAACCGVRANTTAGVLASERVGAAESVIAGDVIAALPGALVPRP